LASGISGGTATFFLGAILNLLGGKPGFLINAKSYCCLHKFMNFEGSNYRDLSNLVQIFTRYPVIKACDHIVQLKCLLSATNRGREWGMLNSEGIPCGDDIASRKNFGSW
jgi:hypothetical protein